MATYILGAGGAVLVDACRVDGVVLPLLLAGQAQHVNEISLRNGRTHNLAAGQLLHDELVHGDEACGIALLLAGAARVNEGCVSFVSCVRTVNDFCRRGLAHCSWSRSWQLGRLRRQRQETRGRRRCTSLLLLACVGLLLRVTEKWARADDLELED